MIQWSERDGINFGLAYHPDEPSENKLFAVNLGYANPTAERKLKAEERLIGFMRSKRLDPARAEGRTIQEMLSAS